MGIGQNCCCKGFFPKTATLRILTPQKRLFFSGRIDPCYRGLFTPPLGGPMIFREQGSKKLGLKGFEVAGHAPDENALLFWVRTSNSVFYAFIYQNVSENCKKDVGLFSIGSMFGGLKKTIFPQMVV